MEKAKFDVLVAKSLVQISLEAAEREVVSLKNALRNQLDNEGQTDFISNARSLELAIARVSSLKDQAKLLEQIG